MQVAQHKMKVVNKANNSIIAQNVMVADTFLTRVVGLLNRKSLPKDEALIITKCNSIHMFFMRFAIDVIFIDKNNQVVGLVERIKPFCLSRIYFKAVSAIEFAEGIIAEKKVSIGDQLEIE